MRKLALIFMFLCAAIPAWSQQNQALSAAAATCTTTGTVCLIVTVDPTQGGATFTVSANASGNTLQFESSGDGAVTWNAQAASPSSGGAAVTSTTSTGSWQTNTAGYTHIRIRMSTNVSGTATVSIIQSLASARAGGPGGSNAGAVTNCTTSGGVAYENGTSNTLTCGASPAYVAGVLSSLSTIPAEDGSFGSFIKYNVTGCETNFGITTVNTGSATTTTGQSCVLSGAVIDAVVIRVTTTIGTATSYEVGYSGSLARFVASGNTNITAGNTVVGAAQLNGGVPQALCGGCAVVVTFAGGTPSAGAMRIIVYSHQATAPTS